MKNRLATYLFALSVLLLGAPPSNAQIPDKFENLQVLPKDLSKQELMAHMRAFARGLGVRCQHCHVGEEGQPLSTFDFASDEKPVKETARIMMKMRQEINQTFMTRLGKEKAQTLQVNCVTCHHGQSRPQTLEQVLTGVLDADGIDAATEKYRELRKQNYGGFAFDFGEFTLLRLASELSEKNLEAAIAMLRLNLEFYPESAFTHYSLGEGYAQKGDKALAIEHLQKALAIQPQNRRAKRRLDQLSKSSDTH